MFLAIGKDIIEFIYGYGIHALLVSGMVSIVYLVLWNIYKIRSYDNSNPAGQIFYKTGQIFLLVFYIYMVIGITILSRSESGTREASFQLFRTFRNTFFARKQIYENVIMFVPYAVLLYGLGGRFRRMWVCILMGAVSSLLIEVTQWVTRTGYFELDDIMLNILGMLIGYVICVLADKFYKKRNFCR